MGCFTYVLLGTAKDITMGPTAIMSLIVSSVVGGVIHGGVDISQAPIYAAALCLMCGIIQLTMGLLNLGEHMPTQALTVACIVFGVWDLLSVQLTCS